MTKAKYTSDFPIERMRRRLAEESSYAKVKAYNQRHKVSK